MGTKVGFICPECEKYYKVEEVGGCSCPVHDKDTTSMDFHTSVFKDGDIEVGADNKVVHIGSRHARKEAEKRYGIAPVEEVKERAKDAQARTKKEYSLSDDQKRLNSYIRRHGMSSSLFESHPTLKRVYHTKRKSR